MEPDEMLQELSFPALHPTQRGTFVKLALRRAQAISVVNVAIVLDFDGTKVRSAAIALGSIAPTIIRADSAESCLMGKRLDEETIQKAGTLARDASRPIDDIRGSAVYRREMVRVITARALRAIRENAERLGFPESPVLLRGLGGRGFKAPARAEHDDGSPIETTINGKACVLSPAHAKSLLRLLREDAGLPGTKEGCAEGECGACTVFLDGEAVMACLVPAPRAHHAEIVTIEGLAVEGRLHPVQSAFVQDAAVQCGYCTPGFVMASAKLLEERPHPGRNEIEEALTGNLCRCTGYYKILKAVEDASMVTA
jgi:carbon-monoxide dehydrogenase medium subunit